MFQFFQQLEQARNGHTQQHLAELALACQLESSFATQYETMAQQFYQMRASEVIQTAHCVVQMVKLVGHFMKQEQEWCTICNLEKMHQEAAIRAIYEQIIDKYKQHWVDKFVTLLHKEQSVMTRVPAANSMLQQVVVEHCVAGTQNIMSSECSMTEKVESLVDLRWQMEQLLRECFVDEETSLRNSDIVTQIAKAFDDLCNQYDDISTILVSLIHSCVLKNVVTCELLFDKIILLMHHTPNKLALEKKCIEFLEKRWLPNIYMKNTDIEYQLCSKLKAIFGESFVLAMEHMLSDVAFSIATTAMWKNQYGMSSEVLSVSLVSSSCWPCISENYTSTALPSILSSAFDEYEVFFKSNNPTKQLTWLPHVGTVHVSWNGCDKPYELIVSPYQMLILQQFNESDFLTIHDIAVQTKLPFNIISSCIVPLTEPVFGAMSNVLIMNCNTDTDMTLQVNNYFSSTNVILQFPAEAPDSEEAHRKVILALDALELEQNISIDRAIVRIMKAKRKMDLVPLLAMVSDTLSKYFVPTKKQMKQRIESLIEREYMTRDGLGIFEYLP